MHSSSTTTPTRLLSLMLFALGSACAAPTLGDEAGQAEERQTDDSAIVTSGTFAKAHGIMRGIDYLPYAYKPDGCYARALYISMELAAERIESNATYAVAKDEQNRLEIPGTTSTWMYHVAPMLMVARAGSDPVARVLDPAMTSAPLTHTDWLRRMGWERGEANAPTLLSVPASKYPVKSDADWSAFVASKAWSDVPSFAALPKFQMADVQHACNIVHAYLANEGKPASVVKTRQAKLVSRSTKLVAELAAVGKLAGPASAFDAATCASCRPVPDGVRCGK